MVVAARNISVRLKFGLQIFEDRLLHPFTLTRRLKREILKDQIVKPLQRFEISQNLIVSDTASDPVKCRIFLYTSHRLHSFSATGSGDQRCREITQIMFSVRFVNITLTCDLKNFSDSFDLFRQNLRIMHIALVKHIEQFIGMQLQRETVLDLFNKTKPHRILFETRIGHHRTDQIKPLIQTKVTIIKTEKASVIYRIATMRPRSKKQIEIKKHFINTYRRRPIECRHEKGVETAFGKVDTITSPAYLRLFDIVKGFYF